MGDVVLQWSTDNIHALLFWLLMTNLHNLMQESESEARYEMYKLKTDLVPVQLSFLKST